MWNMTKANSTTLPEGAQFVLDGGFLLHRIIWNRGSTFESIHNAYTNYVNCKHGKPVVLFDGYQGTGLFLERARGPEARNLAVGPAILAGCGPGWPALIWLSVLQSTFLSEAILITSLL